MDFPDPNSRRSAILIAAWQQFAAYGFRRTSMQDIADAVGLSRPALYLEFSNKTEIFRALAKTLFDQNIENVKQIFQSPVNLEEKLQQTLTISFAEFYKTLEDTPHGEELLSIKTELASDIYLDWLDDIKSAIGAGIQAAISIKAGSNDPFAINPVEISSIIVNTMHGSKTRQTSEDELRKQAKNVIALVMAALRPYLAD